MTYPTDPAWRARGPGAATHQASTASGEALRPANRGLGAVDVSPGTIPTKVIRGVPMVRGAQGAAMATAYAREAIAQRARQEAAAVAERKAAAATTPLIQQPRQRQAGDHNPKMTPYETAKAARARGQK